MLGYTEEAYTHELVAESAIPMLQAAWEIESTLADELEKVQV